MGHKIARKRRLGNHGSAYNRPCENSVQAVCKRALKESGITGQIIRLFADISTGRDVRHAAGLSLGEMSDRILQATGRKYGTGALAHMEAMPVYRRNVDGTRKLKYPMPDDVRQIYVLVLAEAVEREGQGKYRVVVKAGIRVWRARLQVRCKVCDSWFTPERSVQTRCAWCIRHGQTRRKPALIKRAKGGGR